MSDEIDIHRTTIEPASDNVLARFTPEQTARLLRGEPVGSPQWEDPVIAEKMTRQRELLRQALRQSIEIMALSLRELSPSTGNRLLVLGEGALAGDDYKLRLFTAMYTELMARALLP